MSVVLFAALTLLSAQPAAQAEPAETDPTDAADAAARAEKRRFGGEGSTPVQTIGVSGPAAPPAPQWSPPAVRPFELSDAAAAAAGPARREPPAAPPAEPLRVELYDGAYEGPPAPMERVYQAGVENAFHAAQSRMGPLDGAWRLFDAEGRPLYALVLSDPGAAPGEIEGAWRDLRAGPGFGASGLILSAERRGDAVTLRLRLRPDAEPSALRLERARDGAWRGRLQSGGAATAVTLGR